MKFRDWMINKSDQVLSTTRGRVVVAGATLAGAGSAALAEPATMPEIELPIDLASVGTAIAAVGGVMLLTWAGLYIGFTLSKVLIRRIGNVV